MEVQRECVRKKNIARRMFLVTRRKTATYFFGSMSLLQDKNFVILRKKSSYYKIQYVQVHFLLMRRSFVMRQICCFNFESLRCFVNYVI